MESKEKIKELANIKGFNTNIEKDGKILHVQTEVLPKRKLVFTQIYDKGNIVYSDFISFQKFYDDLIDKDPDRLISGVNKLVQLSHQKGIRFLNEQKERIGLDSEKIFVQWLEKTTEGIRGDFPVSQISAFYFDREKSVLIPVNEENKLEISDIFLAKLKNYDVFIRNISRETKEKAIFTFFERDGFLFFMVFYKNNYSGIFVFGKDFPPGLAKYELKRYLTVLDKSENDPK